MDPITLLSIADSCYFSGDATTCLLDQLTASAGGPALFGLVLGAVLFGVFYVASEGSLAVPTVVLVLAGGVIAPMLPDHYGQIAEGVVVMGLAAALWQVIKKYVLSRPVR